MIEKYEVIITIVSKTGYEIHFPYDRFVSKAEAENIIDKLNDEYEENVYAWMSAHSDDNYN